MRLIPTTRKERLLKGFSYPLGAEAISAAGRRSTADNATFWFSWRDEYWASRWQDKLNARGDVVLLEIGYSPHSG